MKGKVKKSNKKSKTRRISYLQTFSPKQLIFFGSIFILTLTSLIILGEFMQPKNEYYKDILIKPTSAPQIKVNYPTAKPPEGFRETIQYKTRQFDTNEMFLGYEWNVKYPEELVSYGENDLTPMSCTRTYWQDLSYENKFATNEEGGPTYSLANDKLLTYIDFLNSKYAPKHAKLISNCTTENGKTFVFYGISMGGGGDYWGKPFLGIDDGTGIKEIIENIGSGGCSALQLLKNDFLYIRCSASEGGGGEHMVSQVNLSNKSVSRLLYCLTEGDKVNCK